MPVALPTRGVDQRSRLVLKSLQTCRWPQLQQHIRRPGAAPPRAPQWQAVGVILDWLGRILRQQGRKPRSARAWPAVGERHSPRSGTQLGGLPARRRRAALPRLLGRSYQSQRPRGWLRLGLRLQRRIPRLLLRLGLRLRQQPRWRGGAAQPRQRGRGESGRGEGRPHGRLGGREQRVAVCAPGCSWHTAFSGGKKGAGDAALTDWGGRLGSGARRGWGRGGGWSGSRRGCASLRRDRRARGLHGRRVREQRG